MWSATQIPHILRSMLAAVTGMPEHKLRVIAPDVGGGFGGKLQVTPEEIARARGAREARQAGEVDRVALRALLSAHHGRDQIQDIEIAANRDGTVLGLKVDLLADMGAYLRWSRRASRSSARSCSTRSTRSRRYRFACTGVFTTKTPTDAYRGAGRPEATFAIERIMDELAAELGMDPMELRGQNWIKHEEFPFTTVARADLRLGQLRGRHRPKAMELFGYDALRREQRERRERGDPVQLGIGISTYTEMCGLAPSRVLGLAGVRRRRLGARVDPDAADRQGRGGHRHVAARPGPRDGVEPDRRRPARRAVRGHRGAARRHPDRAEGHGHLRLAVAGGRRRSRVRQGRARRWSTKARTIAAHMLEATEDDLEFAGGPFAVRGTRARARRSRRSRSAAFAAHDLPDGIEPTLDADATFDPENFSFPHGTHLCAVEVDTETGRVTIRKYVGVDDVGKVVNPLIVEGQVHGGIAQGIAQALFEEAVYDEDGNLVTGTFVDYTAAGGGGPAELHHRPHRDPGDDQPARRQGRRRGGHDRLDPGRGQRGRRRGAPARRQRRRDAVHAGARVAGDPGGAGTRHRRRRRSTPTRRAPASARSTRTTRRKRGPVIPAEFDYVRPGTVDEAVAALRQGGEDAKVLAGGQSLLPLLRLRLAAPTVLVDLGGIAELRGVREDGDRLVIGAMTTHHEVHARSAGRRARGLLAQATATVADPQVRHRGTFGGSLAHADPAGDLGGVALALDAELVIAGPGGDADGAGARVLRRLLHHRARRGRGAGRGAGPEAHRLGQRTTRSSTGSRRRGRSSASPRRSAARTARSPRPGSG